MAIPDENVEILFAGLDQKTDSVATAPGKLERARNVEFDKAGELNKRAGYQSISETAADGVPTNAVRHRLALAGDELLVLTGTLGFSTVSRSESLQTGTRALVRRGVALGGALSFEDIAVGGDVAEDGWPVSQLSPFAAIEQGDAAFLEYTDGSGNVTAYRCYVWQRNAEYTEGSLSNFRGAVIEGRIVAEQPSGASVVVWQGVVRTPAAGEHVDCPRVIARRASFVVHWIEYDEAEVVGPEDRTPAGRDLHRASFDVTEATYQWVQRGSIPTSPYHLYDVGADVEGDDYAVAHLADVNTVAVYRVNGDTWVDNTWISVVDITAEPADENVLAAAKIGTTNALVLYQSRGRMAGVGLDWSDGSTEALTGTLLPNLGPITAIGACRGDGTAGETFVVAEYLPSATGAYASGSTADYPWVLHFETDAGTLASVSSPTSTPGVALSSKPWRYTSGASVVGDVPQFFAMLSHMQSRDGAEYGQANHYVARFERDASEFNGRPVPVGLMNQGLATGSKHGRVPLADPAFVGLPVLSSIGSNPSRRRNHVPAPTRGPSFGPLAKTYTVPLGRWSRVDTGFGVTTSGDFGLIPAGAAFRAARFHHEDPWLVPNDETDAPASSVPYASTSVPHLESVQAGAGLFIAGGTPQVYDGVRFVEAGFAWRPEILNLAEVTGTPIGAENDVFTYVAVYEWRDARGSLHRSSPSDPVSVTISAMPQSIEVTVSTLALSMKDNAALNSGLSRPIRIAVYRTEANGTIFRPVFTGRDGFNLEAHDGLENDPTRDHVSFEDGRTDLQLSQGTPLPYTFADGAWSPLPPEPVPALTAVATWQNRVWGVAAEEPNRIWYSMEILPEPGGEQFTIPEFSGSLTYRVDGIGAITALVPMDSALIVFTRDAIYSLAGSPADANGVNSTLQLQVLQRHTGCVNPRSVASAPDGIYFQSRRGFYHLSRQNTLDYVGAPVEDEIRAAGLIRAVTVHEDSHQVRLAVNGSPTGEPTVLVYDTLMNMWSSWPMPALANTSALSTVQDAVVWRGHDGELAHVVLAQGGLAVQKATTDPTRYADEGAGDPVVAIPVDVRTDWIKLAGIAGFKRVRRIGLQLTKPAEAPFTVEIEYDLDGTFADGANLQTEVVESPAPAYIELHTRIQKCNAIRLRVFEGSDDPTGAQLTSSTMNLHAITLRVARKPGLRRVSPTTQRT